MNGEPKIRDKVLYILMRFCNLSYSDLTIIPISRAMKLYNTHSWFVKEENKIMNTPRKPKGNQGKKLVFNDIKEAMKL